MKKGLTLIELLMAMVMFAAVAGVGIFLFSAVLRTWSSQESRAGINIDLDWKIEGVVRDLREAEEIQSTAGYNEIRFSHDQVTYYIYYFYHPGDGYLPPPAFNQDYYELRRATLIGDINGTFVYGDGTILLRDILPPAISGLSASGNLLTIDLSIERKGVTIRSRTEVRPRNL